MLIKSKVLVSAGLMALFSTAALAADLSSYAEPPVPDLGSASRFDWSGAYLGVHGGLTSPKVNPLTKGKGFSGGAQAGYTMQFGSAVVGAEVEGTWLGGTRAGVTGGQVKEKHRAAAKARVGVALDRTLVYGTAGLAMTKFKGEGGVSTGDGWKKGYIVGGGIEQAIGDRLSARVEYNYTMTNDLKTTSGGVTSRSDLRDHGVKLGLNYRF